jgi:hypothetical protein
VANPNKPFDPNMVVSATHTTDWQWQAVDAQMAELKRLAYINQISRDPGGSTYWTISSKGENYLRELERAEKAIEGSNLGTVPVGNVAPPTLAKRFGATRIAVRRTTSLTFTLNNPNSATSLTNISFNDPLPAGLVISEPNGLLGNYGGGKVIAPPRGNIIRFSGGSLGRNEACSFTVTIEAVDVGPKNNFTSAVSFTEGDSVSGASASLIVMPDGAPVPLAQQLALQLEIRTPNQYRAAMASLFAPGLAVTSFEAVSILSLVPNSEESIDVQSVHSSSVIKNASIIWVDESRDLAVLQLPVEAQLPLPEDLLTGDDDVVTSGKWESYVSLPGRGERDIYGTFGELAPNDGREYRILRVNLPIGDTIAIAGAPVVVDGKLVAIIAKSNIDGSSLYACRISRAILRTVTDSIRSSIEAIPSQAQLFSTIAGYKSDDPIGKDLLDISKEVNALASVLAAKEVEPPLSLGLFGDWGTGKSFFMRCLDRRIRELTDDAKRADGGSQYCREVVQLTFNAWNYIDKDLWASLAAVIFEGLAIALTDKRQEKDSPEARALALAAASSSQDVLLDAEKRRDKAEQELKESEERLARLERNEDSIEAQLAPRELLTQAARFALDNEQVQGFIQDAATQLHVAEGQVVVGEIKSEISELHGIWSTLIFAIRNTEKLWLWLLAFGLALILSASVATLLRHFHVNDVAGHVIAFLTAISGFLAPFVFVARKALNLIQQARTSKQKLIEAAKTKQIDQLKTEQTKIRKEVDAARVAVAQASETAQALNAQLERMRVDRQMVDFIRQRYESSDYRANLGTIARVRSDFQHLSVLLRDVQRESERDIIEMKERQQAKEDERHGKPKLFPRIDRIILYIDDLDRCPEKNVFEVLQAVHLLLAFPLFVVVVGVDPRWLLRSLKLQTLASREEAMEKSESREEERQWESTPMNYLEKIFQIPFTLRPINKSGFGKLVDEYATPSTTSRDGLETQQLPRAFVERAAEEAGRTTASASRENPIVPLSSGAESSQKDESDIMATDAFGASQRTKESPRPRNTMSHTPEPIDRNPRHLQIEERERAFMKTLYELIPSPRAGKRFINIYRLLRASVDNAEYPAFIGTDASGEYQCALLLLGMLTGYPEEATEILETLIRDRPKGTWGDFLNSIKLTAAPIHARSDKEPKVPTSSPPDSPSWNELFSKLPRIKGNIDLRPCSTFVKWAPRVARYSFQSGRALLFQSE